MAMYETEEGLKKIAEFCRSSKGVPVKQAIERTCTLRLLWCVCVCVRPNLALDMDEK